MSRGPSPSPTSLNPSASVSSSSADRPPRPRAALRVNTDQLYPSPSMSRIRSNSQSTFSPNGNSAQPLASHQFSRSFSQNHAVTRTPTSPAGQDDVAMAVNGLRGMLGGASRPSFPGISPIDDSGEEEDEDDDDATLAHIREALENSNDEGDTLDLSRRGIQEIGEEAVEMFRRGVGKDRKGVWRLALSYNSLRDGTIEDSFSRLSRLRYLNLKGNSFTCFPPALTEMAALEILDLSKNRITAFPPTPGRLAQLKVLSLTNNRIHTLPSYLTTFNHLKVFKVDMNPIEWPPKNVLGSLVDNDSGKSTGDAASLANGKPKKDEDLRPWIENMKNWMRQRAHQSDRLSDTKSDEDVYPASEDEPYSAVSTDAPGSAIHGWDGGSQTSLVALSSQQTIRPLREEGSRGVGVYQSPDGARLRAATFSDESLHRTASPDLVPPSQPFARHDRSHSNLSFTPPHSASTCSSSAHSRVPSTNLSVPPPIPTAAGHNRGASYTATQRLSGNLTAKKSLPDLRLSHAQILQERRNDGQPTEESRPLGLGINTPGSTRFQGGPSVWNPSSSSTPTWGKDRPRNLSRKGSGDLLRQMKGTGEMGAKRDPGEGQLADDSRNSYFRRMSTLPVSTISKAIPRALLKFVDAIRGILFALSQLHSALRQYLVIAVSDRVASVFSRVMEPAGTYMNNLINALDRFDSMSRRSTPPVKAIRDVLNTTKESIAVFAKVVAVLRLQLPALKAGDVRYTRTLLLMIYGSIAEIGCSWRAMGPLMVDIHPLLTESSHAMAKVLGNQTMVATGSLTGRTPISPIPERSESGTPSSVARSTASNTAGHSFQSADESPVQAGLNGRSGRSRRQGGSFSTQDVERGMLMTSPRGPHGDGNGEGSNGYIRHRPSESAQIVLEQTEESEGEGEEETLMPLHEAPFVRSGATVVNMPVTPPELSQNPQPIAMMPNGSQTSRNGHKPSSSAGSLSIGLHAVPRKLSVDVRPPTPASATLFDEDLLDVVETATDIAFTVWLKLAEDVGASAPPRHVKSDSQASMASQVDRYESARPPTISTKHHSEMVQLLSDAEHITSALRESLAGLRANPLTWAHTSLPDDAQAFIKTVVRVSELVKLISTSHTFPPNVRQSCSRLTQATRECAILIQVSSLRPGNVTPAGVPQSARPSSPMHFSRSNSQNGPMNSVEDLTVPHSAGWNGPSSSASTGSGGADGGGGGLRGLQLPTRHLASGRSRSPTQLNGHSNGGVPRSAQASQIAF